jgi:hypothetical protein
MAFTHTRKVDAESFIKARIRIRIQNRSQTSGSGSDRIQIRIWIRNTGSRRGHSICMVIQLAQPVCRILYTVNVFTKRSTLQLNNCSGFLVNVVLFNTKLKIVNCYQLFGKTVIVLLFSNKNRLKPNKLNKAENE